MTSPLHQWFIPLEFLTACVSLRYIALSLPALWVVLRVALENDTGEPCPLTLEFVLFSSAGSSFCSASALLSRRLALCASAVFRMQSLFINLHSLLPLPLTLIPVIYCDTLC